MVKTEEPIKNFGEELIGLIVVEVIDSNIWKRIYICNNNKWDWDLIKKYDMYKDMIYAFVYYNWKNLERNVMKEHFNTVYVINEMIIRLKNI